MIDRRRRFGRGRPLRRRRRHHLDSFRGSEWSELGRFAVRDRRFATGLHRRRIRLRVSFAFGMPLLFRLQSFLEREPRGTFLVLLSYRRI